MTQRKIQISPIDAARNNHFPVNCPKCKEGELIREEVDIGVGTQYGSWHCDRCDWSEDLEHVALMKDDHDC